jgi:hypothetical protein
MFATQQGAGFGLKLASPSIPPVVFCKDWSVNPSGGCRTASYQDTKDLREQATAVDRSHRVSSDMSRELNAVVRWNVSKG